MKATTKKMGPNGAVHLTTMPSALLSHILLTQDLRQKQVVAGDSRRSAKKYASLQFTSTPPYSAPHRHQ